MDLTRAQILAACEAACPDQVVDGQLILCRYQDHPGQVVIDEEPSWEAIPAEGTAYSPQGRIVLKLSQDGSKDRRAYVKCDGRFKPGGGTWGRKVYLHEPSGVDCAPLLMAACRAFAVYASVDSEGEFVAKEIARTLFIGELLAVYSCAHDGQSADWPLEQLSRQPDWPAWAVALLADPALAPVADEIRYWVKYREDKGRPQLDDPWDGYGYSMFRD